MDLHIREREDGRFDVFEGTPDTPGRIVTTTATETEAEAFAESLSSPDLLDDVLDDDWDVLDAGSEEDWMPYKLKTQDGQTCVVKKSDGTVVKCHDSRDAAAAHLRALYANAASAGFAAALTEAGIEASGWRGDVLLATDEGQEELEELIKRAKDRTPPLWQRILAKIELPGVRWHNEHIVNLITDHISSCPECTAEMQAITAAGEVDDETAEGLKREADRRLNPSLLDRIMKSFVQLGQRWHNDHLRNLITDHIASCPECAAEAQAAMTAGGWKWGDETDPQDVLTPLLRRFALYWGGVLSHGDHIVNLIVAHKPNRILTAAVRLPSKSTSTSGPDPSYWELTEEEKDEVRWDIERGTDPAKAVDKQMWRKIREAKAPPAPKPPPIGGGPSPIPDPREVINVEDLELRDDIEHSGHIVALLRRMMEKRGMQAHGGEDHGEQHAAPAAPAKPAGDHSNHGGQGGESGHDPNVPTDSDEHFSHMADTFDQMCAEENCPECCKMYAEIARELRDAIETPKGSKERKELAGIMESGIQGDFDDQLPGGGSNRIGDLRDHLLQDPFKGLFSSASRNALVAHAEKVPPSDFVADPELPELQRFVTVTADGRIFGHLAAWGECHIGYGDVCVSPPEESDYSYFTVGTVMTSDGTAVPTGPIALKGGHADLSADAATARAHYDDPNTAKADVVIGSDAHGIWFSGVVRPSASPDDIHSLRASGVSGDWRLIDGQLRLIGICSVNVPGFPKLAMAASADGITSLVAAGGPPESHPDLCDCQDRTADVFTELDSLHRIISDAGLEDIAIERLASRIPPITVTDEDIDDLFARIK